MDSLHQTSFGGSRVAEVSRRHTAIYIVEVEDRQFHHGIINAQETRIVWIPLRESDRLIPSDLDASLSRW
jgi:hypothetical protein